MNTLSALKDTVRMQLEQIFSETEIYSDIVFFFMDLLKQDYKYIVIVPRKCLTLFKCIRLVEPDLKKTKSIIMTPSGMVRHIEDIRKDISCLKEGKTLPDNYLAIVDDIMIYGRGISRILNRLYGMFSEEDAGILTAKTYLEILIESNCAHYIKKNFRDIYINRFNTVRMGYDKPSYRRMSDILIDSFYSVPMPNTSFVRSLIFGCNSMEEACNFFSQKDSMEAIDKTEIGEYKFKLLYDKNNHIFKNISEFNCIRVFYNSKTKFCSVTPYVFLKTMSDEEIDSAFEAFGAYIPKSLYNLKDRENEGDEKLNEKIRNETYVLKYEYLTLLLSDIYGLLSCKSYNENVFEGARFEEDISMLEYTYGVGNVLSLSEINRILRCGNNEAAFHGKWKKDRIYREKNEEKDALDLIEEIRKDNVEDFVNEYFALNGEKDDQNAEKDVQNAEKDLQNAKPEEERMWGITIDTIKSIVSQKCSRNYKDSVFFFDILQCMDSGKAALTIKPVQVGNESLYTSVLNAGEQAYRIRMDPLMKCFGYLKRIEEDCNNNLESNKTDFVVQIFLNGIRKEHLMSTKDIDMVETIINRKGDASYRSLYVLRANAERDEAWEKVYHSICW